MSQVFFFDTPELLSTSGASSSGRGAPGPATTPWSSYGPVVPGASAHLRAARLRRGGRRRACRLRLLRPAQGVTAPGQGAGGHGRRPGGPVAVHQGSARLLRGARAGRDRNRRPVHPRPDHRDEAEVLPQGYDRRMVAELWLYPDGSRILELSTKARRPKRSRWRRGAGVPRGARHRPDRRAADQDQDRARVLRVRAALESDWLTEASYVKQLIIVWFVGPPPSPSPRHSFPRSRSTAAVLGLLVLWRFCSGWSTR